MTPATGPPPDAHPVTAAAYPASLLASIIEDLPNMVFVKEARELRFVLFNRAGEELLGYSRDDLLGRNDYDFFPREQADFFTAKDREVLANRVLVDIPEEPLTTRGGAVRTLHTRKIPIMGADGEPEYLLGISEDITDKKRAEEELSHARDEAERANAAKDEFLSRMSHELRTPLNSVLGFAQLLDGDGLSHDQRDSLDHIMRAGTLLLDLINEVLDLSRINSGHLSLSPEPVGVATTVADAVALAQPMATASGVTLVADDDDGLHVLADAQRLKQVLLNLITNAVKYNRRGGEARVTWETAPGGRVRICVADSGIGIQPAQMALLFEPFNRLGAEKLGIEGTGLGLALSRGLAEAMGGTLAVESTPGAGTAVTLELAQAEPQLERYARERGPASVERDPSARHTLLYIEDNLSNLNLVDRILADRRDLRLISAMQGRLGIELAREHHPDLILLDLHLPDMAGEAVLHELLAQPETRDIPVVVMSADATKGQVKRFLESGARDYLTKPFHIEHFLSVIYAICAPDDAHGVPRSRRRRI